ncbi:MAG TPA: alpha-N-arabinofuranosidase [Tepidisphaeraceae bacterium]|nr:alpha-N-arabinofuranosidase [Tepidisphaeraceae bacterium]
MANQLTINADQGKTVISRHIYGHFAEHLGRCIYEGLWVGEDSPIANTRGFRKDVIDALSQIHIPNLRWPGGCFADTYHWMDGIGPREKRPSIINIHWGGTVENNHVGTHEFFDLAGQLGCEPYVCGNVGSGTVREMAEWLEYITMPAQSPMADLRRKNGRDKPWPVKYWAVGNENWGCGGRMRAEYYADLYRQYSVYCRHFTPGQKLYKIACGFDEPWNQILLDRAHQFIDGLSVHYYTLPGTWEKKGSATKFDEREWVTTVKKAAAIDGFIRRNAGIMDRFDPKKRIGMIMDEWGTWYDVEPGTNPGFLYQQNTVRDAVVAGLSLNILNSHADRVHMANIAQTVNVLQAMALTEGAKMLLTPTYHVFDLYKVHQGATLVPTHVSAADYDMPGADRPTIHGPGAGQPAEDIRAAIPQISASASRDEKSRKLNVSIVNLHHDQAATLAVDVRGRDVTDVSGRIVAGPAMNAMNTFDKPDLVKAQVFDAFKVAKTGITVELPARSVVVLELA